jgi:peptidoglycan/LPS O-acetylase OafA/YrhL
VRLVALSDDAVSGDVWRPLRRRVAVFTAAGGPLFAAYVITHSSSLEGIVVGGPLMATGGFAIGALIAGTGRHAVERVWIALALVVFAVVASIAFAALGM